MNRNVTVSEVKSARTTLRPGLAGLAVAVAIIALGGVPSAFAGSPQASGSTVFPSANAVHARLVKDLGPISVPVGGPVTPHELPGSANPSEPFAGISQGCGFQGGLCGPVNPVTGALSLTFSDLSIPERGPALDLTRTYNSVFDSIPGPFGNGWSFSWGMHLTFTKAAVVFHQENGSEVTFSRTKSNSVFKSAPRVIAALSLARKAGRARRNTANTVSFVVTRGSRQPSCNTFDQACVMFGFSKSGRLLQETDMDGNTTAFHYNAAGQLTSVTDAAGRTFTLSYQGRFISQVTGPSGVIAKYGYDAHGCLFSFASRLMEEEGIYYFFRYSSGKHQLIGASDPLKHQTQFAYDSHGRVTAITDPLGYLTRFTYAKSSTTVTSPGGSKKVVTVNHYEAITLERGVTNGGAFAAWAQRFDPKTLAPIAIQDPNGNLWKYSYDSLGDLTTATDPLGHATRYAYGVAAHTATVTDPMGASTRYAYDARGNLISIHGPLPVETTLHYGSAAHPGDVTSVTDPSGHVWAYAYDADGNLIGATDPDGNKTTGTYDLLGNLLSLTSPNGNVPAGNSGQFTTRYAYDADGRLVSITDPLGHVSSQTLNAVGQIVSATNALGNSTSYAYDADGRLVRMTPPDGTIVADTYTADGNVASQTDPSGHTTSYSYDALGRLISTTDPLGRFEAFHYDPTGNLIQVRRPDGSLVNHSYNSAGQLVSTTFSTPNTHSVSYAYDADGRRLSMTDGTGTSTYSYDAGGRLTKTVNGDGKIVSYGYDTRGETSSITYPDSGVVTYGYDAAGRMVSLTDMRGNQTTYQYDADGNLIGTTMPNLQHLAYSYDADGRIVSIQDVTGATTNLSLTYDRNAGGLVTLTQQSGGSLPPQQTTYSYDVDGRLTGEDGGQYAYDASDDPTSVPSGASLTYDAGHQLQSMGVAGSSTTYSYDANGNRIGSSLGGATTSLTYDGAGNLTGYANSSTSVTYATDGDGLRTASTAGPSKQTFVWSPASFPPSLIQVGTTDIVYGPTALPQEQVTPAGNSQYFIPDQQGNTRMLTDPSGNVLATYNYDAFGNVTGHTGSGTTQFGFAGRYTDPISGIVDMPAGQYDPGTRQYISHIGQEVIVDFLEGDPDRPLVVGNIYNSEQMPAVVGPAGEEIYTDRYGRLRQVGSLVSGSGGGLTIFGGGTLIVGGFSSFTDHFTSIPVGGPPVNGSGGGLNGDGIPVNGNGGSIDGNGLPVNGTGGGLNGTGVLANGSGLTTNGSGTLTLGSGGGGLTKTGGGVLDLGSGGGLGSGGELVLTGTGIGAGGGLLGGSGNTWGGAITLGGGGCNTLPCLSSALASAATDPASLERIDPYVSGPAQVARIDPYVIANDDPVNP